MQFKITYDDIKKLLGVFYNSPYQISAPYVDILHNLKDDLDTSFLTHLEAEKTLIATAEAQRNSANAGPVEVKAE